MLESINPATGETHQRYPETPEVEIPPILERARAAFEEWRRVPMTQRAEIMRAAGEQLRRQTEDLGALITREMGKPLSQAKAEVEKCAKACDYYAENAEDFLAPEKIKTEAASSYVHFQPLGVILAVMPWNFPFWQLFRCAAPALMAGNAMVLKHASNVPGCALALEEVMTQAGFPPGLFRTLLIGSKNLEKVIEHPAIQGVTLTGSLPAGQAVAAQAGRALKKTVLELGGSDPYVILEDADLESTVEACATSRMINSGQSCIAAKRFIVVEPLRRQFEAQMVEAMQAKKMGNPMEENVDYGPLARPDLRETLHRQVQQSVEKGAKILLGGEIPAGCGNFYPATVLSQVQKGMPVYAEETFGPATTIIGVQDEKEALRVANDTGFGLGAALFTKDTKRGERLAAEELQAGCCFVNDFVRSDPRLPFGGVKQSGYGRELGSFGIREFVNIKTVYVK